MCFNMDNARRLINSLDKALTDIESGTVSDIIPTPGGDTDNIPMNILGDLGQSSPPGTMEHSGTLNDSDSDSEIAAKRPRFEDID